MTVTAALPTAFLENLDGMWEDDLREYVGALTDFLSSPGLSEETQRVGKLLLSYARHKAQAMQARLRGEVGSASAAEDRAEACYERLPEWARW